MVQTKQIQGSAPPTTIASFAQYWEVSEKTVGNWIEFTYQAFEAVIPNAGELPDWAIELLTLCAKHLSKKANLYFAETGERRRLKASEYVVKIRKLREAGHFQNFQKFQQFQDSPELPAAADLEDELLAEVGQLTRDGDQRIAKLKAAIEQREDQQVAEVIGFVEDSDHRVLNKLTNRLKASKALAAAIDAQPRIDDAIEVAYSVED